MNNKIQINPSIAVDIDIKSIGLNECVEIRFIATANWTGSYKVSVYNSEAKNSVVEPNALTIEENRMSWVIEPLAQSIREGSNFYEIVELQSKRIIFRGQLKITK